MSTIISPSLLSASFLNLKDEILAFEKAKDLWFHLDIMDSHFVPNLTFGEPVLKNIKKITKHKLDAHFMVTNPDFYLENFKTLGIYNFTFHWESLVHHDRFISEAKKIYPSVGISLNPSTPIHLIPDYILKKIDLVLIMSVNPGFGGQSFIEDSIQKVKLLSQIRKKQKLKFQIQVDGGVTNKNAKLLTEAGADNLVAGSFIFNGKPDNYLKNVNLLRGL